MLKSSEKKEHITFEKKKYNFFKFVKSSKNKNLRKTLCFLI